MLNPFLCVNNWSLSWIVSEEDSSYKLKKVHFNGDVQFGVDNKVNVRFVIIEMWFEWTDIEFIFELKHGIGDTLDYKKSTDLKGW